MTAIGALDTALLLGALLGLAGILSSLVARRFGAPLLFLFLIVGMVAGQDGPGGIVFNDMSLTYLVGSTALAIILFDGGLRTKVAQFRGVLVPALGLATIGVGVTGAQVGAFAVWVFDLGWIEALLLGAIVASTDAAAVMFLLHAGGLRLTRRVGAVLEIESATNDPFAVFLVVLLTELILAGGDPTSDALSFLARQGLIGTVVGLAGGFALVALLNRLDLPAGLHPLLALAGVVTLFGLAAVAHGSGFLAVYLAGLVVGNRPVKGFPAILSLHQGLTWLSQIVMFLVLGLLVTPTTLIDYALPGVAVALFLIVLARPVAVALCLLPFGFSVREWGFVTWVGLRGAVSIYLAAIPTLAAVPGAAAYFNVAFFVVLVSLVVQGWSIRPAARALRVALAGSEPDVSRVELDIPGQTGRELVGYPVRHGSVVEAHGTLPSDTRLVLAVRNGQVLDPSAVGRPGAGDYVYLLAAPERVHRLDRLFAEGGAAEPDGGEFAVNGTTRLGALAELYGLEVPEAERHLTVADFLAERLEDAPELGDAVTIGPIDLVVRDLEGGTVTRAALHLPEGSAWERAALRLRRVAAVPRRAWRRLRSTIS
jgi:cell volume regulation protein A